MSVTCFHLGILIDYVKLADRARMCAYTSSKRTRTIMQLLQSSSRSPTPAALQWGA